MKPYCDFPLCFVDEPHAHASGMSSGSEKGLAAGLDTLERISPEVGKAVVKYETHLESVEERRRYALLQAACLIYNNTYEPSCVHDDEEFCCDAIALCVTEAEKLLAEIERREKV